MSTCVFADPFAGHVSPFCYLGGGDRYPGLLSLKSKLQDLYSIAHLHGGFTLVPRNKRRILVEGTHSVYFGRAGLDAIAPFAIR